MTGLEIFLLIAFGSIYVALLLTVATITFQKRLYVMFVAGFFLPFLWLIGSMMAPRPGSTYKGRL